MIDASFGKDASKWLAIWLPGPELHPHAVSVELGLAGIRTQGLPESGQPSIPGHTPRGYMVPVEPRCNPGVLPI